GRRLDGRGVRWLRLRGIGFRLRGRGRRLLGRGRRLLYGGRRSVYGGWRSGGGRVDRRAFLGLGGERFLGRESWCVLGSQRRFHGRPGAVPGRGRAIPRRRRAEPAARRRAAAAGDAF